MAAGEDESTSVLVKHRVAATIRWPTNIICDDEMDGKMHKSSEWRTVRGISDERNAQNNTREEQVHFIVQRDILTVNDLTVV